MPKCKRVAVIGGGNSGLAAIKCCLDEGLDAVCLERTDEVGGLWRYTEKARDGQGCVMKSTVINTSKEMMSFSDFPIPKEYPNYMPHALVWQYFQDYAQHFQLLQHVRHNVEVMRVSPAPNHDSTGRWSVQLLDHKSGEQSTETFDAVLVCTGHHAEKNVPTFPGLGDFQGEVVHSHDYREPSSYAGKRSVVIGIGNSGGDLAVELCRSGQVYLSTRSGSWILHRIIDYGIPLDIVLNSRISQIMKNVLPWSVSNWLAARQLNKRFDHRMYGMMPDHPPLAQHPTVNDALANCIANGRVKVKPDIRRFTATGVEFVDGSFEDDIEVVVLATGYRFGFPFVDKSVVEVKENRLPFFKYMFNPDLQHPTLAFIGCVQPVGAIMPISELQCRLATRVFKGDVKLPPAAQMWEDIRAKEAALAQRYTRSTRHTIQVDYVNFMDELAELNGCKPDLVSLLMKDPRLALEMTFGGCTPCQYRLKGPGQWSGARDAILTTMDRIRYPLSTRPVPSSASFAAGRSHFLLWLLALALTLFVIRAIFL